MHNPIRIAEDFAMVDLLSNGRLDFGVGRDMHPLEYSVFQADWSSAQSRLPEALDMVVRIMQRIIETIGPMHIGLVFHFGGLS